MSRRVAAWLGWSLFGASAVLIVLSWVFAAAGGGIPEFDAVSSVILLLLPAIGALVASRRPENPIGWLLLGSGLLMALSGASYGYAVFALSDGRALAGGVAAAWLTSWVFLPALFGIPPLLFLLFPDGRPLTPRWRYAVWLTVIGLVATSAGAALRPGELVDAPVPDVDNPIGVPGPLALLLENIGWTTSLVAVLLGATSLVMRYRRSRGEERLQLRWFTSAAVFFLVCVTVSVALFVTPIAWVGQLFVIVGFSTIPIAAGVAILRYRLYDIDLVINRTLVYSSLTLTLVATYLLSVLVLQTLLRPLVGDSDLAVAASTLGVAALFRPLRARIQHVVDRRFFRSRYDSTRTLERFSGRLRHELDLDTLGYDLRRAIGDTMQPEHVSLWLRGTTRHDRRNDSRTPVP